MLATSQDLFGSRLASDARILQASSAGEAMFIYWNGFELDVNDQLKNESESVRSYSIDAEAIIGMFSAAQCHAPNATLCYL